VTEASRRHDAFDQWAYQWCLCQYAVFFASRRNDTSHLIMTVSVRSQTIQPQVSSLIGLQQCRLKLFGHSSGCSLRTTHVRYDRLPVDWRRARGRPRHAVLASNNGERSQTAQPWTSLCIAASNADRHSWRCIVETAMLFERAT